MFSKAVELFNTLLPYRCAAKLNNNLPQEPITDAFEPFESARAWVRGLHLRPAAEWRPYVAPHKREPPLGGARSRAGG